jgi:hypothetical protein
MTWLISLLVIGVGSLLVIKTQWIYDFTGPIDWAEQHLGSEGGTRLFIKLLGVLMIMGTFLAATGILGGWITGFFSGLGGF